MLKYPNASRFFIYRDFYPMNFQFYIFELLCHFQYTVSIVKYIRGELMVHIENETLEDIFKQARQNSELTIEELAFRVKIMPRYLYHIENEGKKPSFDVLYSLIRELSISPDLIFYPEKSKADSEIDTLIRQLYKCDKCALDVIKATVSALIETAGYKK